MKKFTSAFVTFSISLICLALSTTAPLAKPNSLSFVITGEQSIEGRTFVDELGNKSVVNHYNAQGIGDLAVHKSTGTLRLKITDQMESFSETIDGTQSKVNVTGNMLIVSDSVNRSGRFYDAAVQISREYISTSQTVDPSTHTTTQQTKVTHQNKGYLQIDGAKKTAVLSLDESTGFISPLNKWIFKLEFLK